MPLPGQGQVGHPEPAGDRQEEAFDEEARLGVGLHLLAHDPIGAEGQGQDHRHPGKVPEGQALEGDPDPSQDNGAEPQDVEALAEDQGARRHVQQRRQVVAEAALQHPAGVDPPDIEGPVGADQECRQGEHPQKPGRTQDRRHLGALAGEDDKNPGGQGSPDRPVSENLPGIGTQPAHDLEEEGRKPPDQVAQDTGADGGAR